MGKKLICKHCGRTIEDVRIKKVYECDEKSDVISIQCNDCFLAEREIKLQEIESQINKFINEFVEFYNIKNFSVKMENKEVKVEIEANNDFYRYDAENNIFVRLKSD